MKKTITSEVMVGYSQCPRKAYLLLCTKERGIQHEYMQILEKQRQTAQRNFIDNLRQENADVQPYSLDNLKGNHKYLVDATISSVSVKVEGWADSTGTHGSTLFRAQVNPMLFYKTPTLRVLPLRGRCRESGLVYCKRVTLRSSKEWRGIS